MKPGHELARWVEQRLLAEAENKNAYGTIATKTSQGATERARAPVGRLIVFTPAVRGRRDEEGVEKDFEGENELELDEQEDVIAGLSAG